MRYWKLNQVQENWCKRCAIEEVMAIHPLFEKACSDSEMAAWFDAVQANNEILMELDEEGFPIYQACEKYEREILPVLLEEHYTSYYDTLIAILGREDLLDIPV